MANAVINLQSVCIDMPKKKLDHAIQTGEFDDIRELVLDEIKRAFHRGEGIESVEEL